MKIAIIGAGPSGLMAAEILGSNGYQVDIFERMPTPARKFLMAGKSGLNITHNEPFDAFLSRYNEYEKYLSAPIKSHSPGDIQNWMKGLGNEPFVGSSGRVFPKVMKASPLLRAWIKRLEMCRVKLFTRHHWTGWNNDGQLVFNTPNGDQFHDYGVTILALGGASWPKLGSTGDWGDYLRNHNIKVTNFAPSNCGFTVNWSKHLIDNFAGTPVKNIKVSIKDNRGETHCTQGDLMIASYGVEGGPTYTLSRFAREKLQAGQNTYFELDLAPDRSEADITKALSKPRGKKSMSTHLKRSVGIAGVKSALLYECRPKQTLHSGDIPALAKAIKSTRIKLETPRPIEEAISSAGGVCFSGLDENLMVKDKPGLFCAGEMIDWEAPTGGYLITACLAQGKQAAEGVLKWLKTHNQNP
ncbi:TIGR03862 family flavoprotein [Kordiimonas sp. SCSIO 12610]|uniref:TIGR03862 family flavoprotein n=1 Tax=Kordiimonas sp. SCSIO 12610 TaxID=2829597 RepID=UPI00210CB5F3|nr:TIGR03862 family flavoprotein [Kordiimonas sp. SCSIO 12610]UTW55393.1 TIGR03862 family flavoprotein [Kordiimonas sp. SCSIO 12610]